MFIKIIMGRGPLVLLAFASASFAELLHAEPNAVVPNTVQAPSKDFGAPSTASAGALPGQVSEPSKVLPEQAALADWLEKSFEGTEMPESARMLSAIARGSQMGPGEGWFGPSATRYDWNWLADMHGSTAAGEIGQEQFHGPKEVFVRLDRNQDGRLTAGDLDWSDRNPYVQQFNLVSRLLRRMNKKGDGRLSRDEYLAVFDQAAAGRDYVTASDLAEVLLAGFESAAVSNEGPTPDTLVRGLFRGEIGSLNAGPSLNASAPDFSLKTHDGQQTVRLADLRGPKPIVLVFGNFTCGPFRSTFPLVDELCQRYQAQAAFLGIYVREAHPTDGWRMNSNAKAGVELAQPKTYAERVSVAQQCQATLKYSMPLLVDEINDPVGNAYSGMPARLYIIDTEGKVAYKSGRGPFGFKPGELEQALLMTLLDGRHKAEPSAAEATK